LTSGSIARIAPSENTAYPSHCAQKMGTSQSGRILTLEPNVQGTVQLPPLNHMAMSVVLSTFLLPARTRPPSVFDTAFTE
jgi:hypothetical protein